VVLMYAVKATGTLRVSRAGEIEGLDLHEHGVVAYPEYALTATAPGKAIAGTGTARAPAFVTAQTAN